VWGCQHVESPQTYQHNRIHSISISLSLTCLLHALPLCDIGSTAEYVLHVLHARSSKCCRGCWSVMEGSMGLSLCTLPRAGLWAACWRWALC
jgi:hypothetical protein